MGAPNFTLTLVGDQQQLHCTGHDEPLLLGEWPALVDGEWDFETAAGIEKAVLDHGRDAHAVDGDAQP